MLDLRMTRTEIMKALKEPQIITIERYTTLRGVRVQKIDTTKTPIRLIEEGYDFNGNLTYEEETKHMNLSTAISVSYQNPAYNTI